jgi:EAL domain-containing protein (putative c-di-GMP-specific phosphodiesterase class I)
VNISGFQLRQESFFKIISKVLDDSGLDPQYLELELTENVLMKNAENTISTLYRLKNMGIQLSIDDFGTGYSSFTYLRRFPVDLIKIDQTFIKDITKNDGDAAIVKAMIVMAHTLKLRVIAEGVETAQQLAFLHEEGCDEIQGYILSAPLPAEGFSDFLIKERDRLY